MKTQIIHREDREKRWESGKGTMMTGEPTTALHVYMTSGAAPVEVIMFFLGGGAWRPDKNLQKNISNISP